MAFEANPSVSKYLKQSVEMNGLLSVVNVFDKGAGDTPGEAYVNFGVKNIGGGSIVNQPGDGTLKTEIVRLDDVISDKKVDLIKIDVEGYEFKVLKGAQTLLEYNKEDLILMMEWIPGHLNNKGTDPEVFVDFLKKRGGKVWRVGKIKDDEPPLVAITWEALLKTEAMDIVISKRPLDD